jgi:hypothetical protein
MISASECQLKANNLEIAARSASPDNRMLYIQAAAEWRRRAHEILMEQPDPYMDGVAEAASGQPEKSRSAD